MTYPDSTIKFQPLSTHPHFRNLNHQTFDRLTVLGYVGRGANWNALWRCKCICGNEIVAIGTTLLGGRKRSCGCLPRELSSQRLKTHGQGGSPTYNTWHDMLRRCYNPTNKAFQNYGGRDITVCDRWHKFENFFADMGERPVGLTLDRVDNNGNYEKKNCKWANKIEQMNNTRHNHMITFNGKTQSLMLWTRELHINYDMVKVRLQNGWSIEKAFTTPKM